MSTRSAQRHRASAKRQTSANQAPLLVTAWRHTSKTGPGAFYWYTAWRLVTYRQAVALRELIGLFKCVVSQPKPLPSYCSRQAPIPLSFLTLSLWTNPSPHFHSLIPNSFLNSIILASNWNPFSCPYSHSLTLPPHTHQAKCLCSCFHHSTSPRTNPLSQTPQSHFL